jgi:hypothetical protein
VDPGLGPPENVQHLDLMRSLAGNLMIVTKQLGSDNRPAGISERHRIKDALAAGSCGLLWLIYLAIYLPFLPTAINTVGHDYSLHFPNLLTGYYWFLHNGLFVIPWFSPSQCGGFAYFPDPNVAYFSVPQFLVFLVSPMKAVRLTFVLFSLVGLVGSYVLMRRAFQSSRAAATVAAGLFLFNGFFVYRMLIGHLTFHAFALTPLMVAALLPRSAYRHLPVAESAGRLCVAAICLAYMFQSGMVHGIPPVLMATVVIFLVHGLLFGWQWQPWLLLAGAGTLSLALCAGKLVAEVALLSNFPRDMYPLPGIAGLPTTLLVALQTLFSSAPPDAAVIVTNSMWALERHEWEYGVSAAPLFLFVLAIAAGMNNLFRRRKPAPVTIGGVIAVGSMLVVLSAPILLNWYRPDWNAFLKTLPYFGNSVTLLRFFSAYILVVIVVACLALDRLPLPAAGKFGRPLLACISLGIMLLQNVGTDRRFYSSQGYSIVPIETAYAHAHATHMVPSIEAIGSDGGNEAMVNGISQMSCYQPLFGYRLENFQAAPLRLGRVIVHGGQSINAKNPACYVFPAENSCNPGDHFAMVKEEQAAAFLSYRPFAFEQPYRQELATWVSLLSMIGIIVTLLALTVKALSGWRSKSGGAG